MPAADDLKSWRAELKEILDVCARRASLPLTLPHCAICARYATDNLPFEALMSLLDVMPAEMRAEALAVARDRLSALPPAMRQQHVDAVTLPVLMDSPGWPLVRGLVIDMAKQEIHKHFEDARLSQIEEITLLGFAYGGCGVQPAFYEALFHSGGFANLRTLIFHSTESDRDLSKRFWASPLARRLERIDGVPYFGDPVIGPLAVRELKLAGCRELPDGFSLGGLLGESTSPRLKALSMDAYSERLAPFLDLIAREGRLLERIDSVTLNLSDFDGKHAHLVGPATLPASAGAVTWYSSLYEASLIKLRGEGDIHTLYDLADEKIDLRFADKVTEYNNLVFAWDLREQVSRRVEDLSLLLPLEIDIARVLDFLDLLPALKKLTLIYPFAKDEIEALLHSEKNRQLEALSLLLNIAGGQWRAEHTNEYMKANLSRYQSGLPASWLFDLAFGEPTASIHNLSLFTRSFDLTRSPERIEHCDLHDEEAAHALAACNPRRPIEVLNFDYDLYIGEDLATALAGSDMLGRVYRLNLNCRLDEAGAQILAGCRHLRDVRDLKFFFNHGSIDTIKTLLYSPRLAGVWDVDLYLPDSGEEKDIEAVCADAPLLDRAVALELHGPNRSLLIPRGGRLGRLRRLGEGLTMSVFGDARLATVWKDHPIGLPLRARLRDFIERTYRVDYRQEDLPDLEKKLLAYRPWDDDDDFMQALRALLATAFAGKPVPENTPFAALTDNQQSALRAIAQVEGDCWNIGGLMSDVMTSYGFRIWDQQRLKNYIAGRDKEAD